jgi:hypothetical protein
VPASTTPAAASLYDFVLAIHIMAVVVGFGVVFAYPVMFALGARHDPRSLPLLHRIEYSIERWLVNPGLLVVVGAGAYLASDGHRWGQFFVQWGIGAAVVIGALVGSVMIPTAKRAERLARADPAGVGGTGTGRADGEAGESTAPGEPRVPGEEYQRLARRLAAVGSLLSLLVLVTILFMAIKP